MRLRQPALKAALILLLATGARTAPFEDPVTGYRTSIPDSWRHKFDEAQQTLLVAAAGGLRIRVEAEVADTGLDQTAVMTSYRTDGLRLKETSEAFKVLQKPIRSTGLGEVVTFRYAFTYRSGESVSHAMAWLASERARQPKKQLRLKVLAYGPRDVFQTQRIPLKQFLDAFRWPKPPPEIAEPDAGEDPTGTPAGGTALVVRPTAGTRESNSDGDDSKDRTERAGNFTRGSLSGNVGAMADGGVVSDPAMIARFDRATRIANRQRSAEEKAKAAARMGFDLDSSKEHFENQ